MTSARTGRSNPADERIHERTGGRTEGRTEGRTDGRAVFGLGLLDRWVDDDAVEEVLGNGGSQVWIARRGVAGTQYVGRLEPGVVDVVIERLLAPTGRRLDRAAPVVDARLPDGTRVCAVLPPVAPDGPCLALRKFPRHHLGLDRFATPDVIPLLDEVVHARCNVLVSGATSSGKTSLLNALASRVHADERIITLEDTAELRLATAHVLRLETRPASVEGVDAVDMTALVRTALRLRPDRLIVGEIRGDEAADLVQALNTGHDGSLATLHANSPDDALARLRSLVVRAAPGWPLDDVAVQIARSIDVVVHVERDRVGVRSVRQVVEVDGTRGTVRCLASDGVRAGELIRRRR
ncbi:MAG: CpaF family protein [Actinomycetes bacterium]